MSSASSMFCAVLVRVGGLGVKGHLFWRGGVGLRLCIART